jgi:AbrB family looped-hinge helix DNA binding protein
MSQNQSRITTTVTAKGQITIPIATRTKLGITAGQPIAIAVVGEELHCTMLPRTTKHSRLLQ